MGIDLGDKIIGSAAGLAVGDALGAPLEGSKPGAVRSAYGIVRNYVDRELILGREKIYRWNKPGLYTDDTQQALAVLDSLLIDRGLQPAKLAGRMAELSQASEYRFGAWRGVSRNFRLTMEKLKNGVPWDETGEDSAGNGAAARVAPVALYFYENPDEMADAAARVSLITHRNPIAVSGAIAIAFFTARLLFIEELASKDACELIADVSARVHDAEKMLEARYGAFFNYESIKKLHLFSDTLKGLSERFEEPPEKVSEWIAANAAPHADSEVTRPTVGLCLTSVVYSIYVALSFPESFEDAVVAAVNSGGDADTIGAMTGAMSGALRGVKDIPQRWLDGLYNKKQILARAEALSEKKYPRNRIENLYDMEIASTAREHDERLARMKKFNVNFPEPRLDKYSAPAPVEGKFDSKQYRKDLRKTDKYKFFKD